jgi:hypothetical protein
MWTVLIVLQFPAQNGTQGWGFDVDIPDLTPAIPQKEDPYWVVGLKWQRLHRNNTHFLPVRAPFYSGPARTI